MKHPALLSLKARLPQREVRRNLVLIASSNFLRLGVQALLFVVLGRTIGVEGFGAFAGSQAFVGLFAPFAGWGMGNVLIMHVSRNNAKFPEFMGAALVIGLIAGVTSLVAATLLSSIVLPSVPWLLIFCLAVSDLLLAPLFLLCGQAFQGLDRLGITGAFNVVWSLVRLGAVLVFATVYSDPTATQWGIWNLTVSGAVAMALFWTTWVLLGPPRVVGAMIVPSFREGWHFSISIAAQTAYNDIDKMLLTRLSTFEATGVYAAAHRIIMVTFVPVRTVLTVTYAKYFQEGKKGIRGSAALTKRIAPFSVAYGFVASAGLFISAPLLPSVLGEDYAGAVSALQWLSPIIFLQTLHSLAADTLSGAGYQRVRSWVQATAAAVNAGCCMFLIPRFGWQGAVFASLVTHILLTLSLIFLSVYFVRCQDRAVLKESTRE